jgi:hypothetical protein
MRFVENWSEAWSAPNGLVIFSGKDCLNCKELSAQLQDARTSDLNFPTGIVAAWLVKESSAAGEFRLQHPEVIAVIDMLPFAIFTTNGIPTATVRAATIAGLAAAGDNP